MRTIDRLRGCRPFDPQKNLPQIVRAGYRNHNIIFFQGAFFGARQSLGKFNPALIQSESTCPYLRGHSIEEVQSRIIEWSMTQPWNWRQVALFRLAARVIRPFVPSLLVEAIRRRRKWDEHLDETVIAELIRPGEIKAERKAA
jgi:hypothetical protein